MNAHQLVADLRERGVVFEPDGSSLRVDAPSGVLTEQLRRELADRKVEVLAALSEGRPPTPQADDPIVAMTLDEFASAGLVVVVESRLLRSRVLFVSDNVPDDQIGDDGLPVYRASELKKLALLKPSRSMLRTINEAKTIFRGERATIEGISRED